MSKILKRSWENIPLVLINQSDETQIRKELNWKVVDEYAAMMKEGIEFDPVTVFKPNKKDKLILADGFHRIAAIEQINGKKVRAHVRAGGIDEALRYAGQINKSHGIKMTNADKRHAIEKGLKRWPDMTDLQIAEWIGVSRMTVGRVRAELQCEQVHIQPEAEKQVRVRRDGKRYTVPPRGRRVYPILKVKSPPPRQNVSDESVREPETSKSAPPPRSKAGKPVDAIGQEIPDEIVHMWEKGQEIKELIKKAKEVFDKLQEEHEAGNVLYANANIQYIASQAQTVVELLKGRALPHVICPNCSGINDISSCMICKGSGFINKFMWKSGTTEEIKQLINLGG